MTWQFGVFVVTVGGVLYLVLRDQGETPTAAASTPSSRAKTITNTITKNVAGADRVVTRDVPSFTQGATKIVQGPAAPADSTKAFVGAIAKSLGSFVAPLAPQAASATLRGAGGFLQSGDLGALSQGNVRTAFEPFAQDASAFTGFQRGAGPGPLQPLSDKIGGALSSAGDSLGSVTPLAGVFGVAAASQKWTSSQKGETKLFGKAAETTIQTGIGYVPILGGALSAIVGVVGGTYEGQRFFNNVLGRPIQQGYTVQKDLFNGDFKGVSEVFGLGGSTHKERVASFFDNVSGRLQALDKGGGVISAADLAQFKQALSYGYTPETSGNHALPYLPGNAQTGDFRSWVNGLKVGEKFNPITTASTQAAAAKADLTAKTAELTKRGFTADAIKKAGGAEIAVEAVKRTDQRTADLAASAKSNAAQSAKFAAEGGTARSFQEAQTANMLASQARNKAPAVAADPWAALKARFPGGKIGGMVVSW